MSIIIGQIYKIKDVTSPWYGLNCSVIQLVGTLAKVTVEGKFYLDAAGNYQHQVFVISIDKLTAVDAELPSINNPAINDAFNYQAQPQQNTLSDSFLPSVFGFAFADYPSASLSFSSLFFGL